MVRQQSKKRGNKTLLIILAILALVVVAAVVYNYSMPKNKGLMGPASGALTPAECRAKCDEEFEKCKTTAHVDFVECLKNEESVLRAAIRECANVADCPGNIYCRDINEIDGTFNPHGCRWYGEDGCCDWGTSCMECVQKAQEKAEKDIAENCIKPKDTAWKKCIKEHDACIRRCGGGVPR